MFSVIRTNSIQFKFISVSSLVNLEIMHVFKPVSLFVWSNFNFANSLAAKTNFLRNSSS